MVKYSNFSTGSFASQWSRLTDLRRFDGFALQHRFEITAEGRVFYRSRRTCDEYIQSIQETGRTAITFGQQDICESFFHKFFTLFSAEVDNGPDSARNVQVTLTPNFPTGSKGEQSHRNKSGLRNLFVKTDANVLRSLDPETLEPLESMNYGKFVEGTSNAMLAASHAATDPETGELFNFALKLGKDPTYTLFKLCPPTETEEARSKILATITDAPAAYIHSVCLTKKYFVFCVWQADFKLSGAPIPFYKNLVQSFKAWDPNRRVLWYVIDRDRGGVVRKYTSDPFFAFHHINAFDEGDNVVVDLCTFDSHEIVNSFYLEVLRSSTAKSTIEPPPMVNRIVLADISAAPVSVVGSATITKTSVLLDLPTVSSSRVWQPQRYAYGVSSRGLSSLWDCILKVDIPLLFSNPLDPPAGAIKRLERPFCTPSEPIFVPRPGATEEDDGVVLMIELDGIKGKSALVVIDAQSFEEVGRAEVKDGVFVVPHHFHGAWCGSL
jgi:torulene dioxygenase